MIKQFKAWIYHTVFGMRCGIDYLSDCKHCKREFEKWRKEQERLQKSR